MAATKTCRSAILDMIMFNSHVNTDGLMSINLFPRFTLMSEKGRKAGELLLNTK